MQWIEWSLGDRKEEIEKRKEGGAAASQSGTAVVEAAISAHRAYRPEGGPASYLLIPIS